MNLFHRCETHTIRLLTFVTLAVLLFSVADDGWAGSVRAKRKIKTIQQDRSFGVEADESVSEQVNDPTAFLREVRVDAVFEQSHESQVEWTPTLAMPLGRLFRFEAGVPLLSNGADGQDQLEWGDIYGSLAYIFRQTPNYNALVDVRLDLPTGSEFHGAGLNIPQWHFALGSVIYRYEKQGFLLLPFLEYRRSFLEKKGLDGIGHLIGSLGVVYLLSGESFLRGDWTVDLNEKKNWSNASHLNFEIGHVFLERYALSLGYQINLWSEVESPNAGTLSIGYLF